MSRSKLVIAGLLVAVLAGILALAFAFGDPASGSSDEATGIAGLAAVVVACLAAYLGRKSGRKDRNG